VKLVDQLYDLYKDQLVGDEEDALIIVAGILGELDREHYLDWISQMSEHDLFEMFGNYLVYKLRNKMAEEGLGKHDGDGGRPPSDGVVH
jgi:hypothetical protein